MNDVILAQKVCTNKNQSHIPLALVRSLSFLREVLHSCWLSQHLRQAVQIFYGNYGIKRKVNILNFQNNFTHFFTISRVVLDTLLLLIFAGLNFQDFCDYKKFKRLMSW